jgi:hypothetical protein
MVRTIGSAKKFTLDVNRYDDDDNQRIVDRVQAAVDDHTGRLKLFLDHTGATEIPGTLMSRLRRTLVELHCNNSAKLTALPLELGHFAKTLQIIDCSRCALTSLPEEMSQLRALHTLRAAHNRLTTFLWDCHGLKGLKHLDISHNDITYFSPSAAAVFLETEDGSAMDAATTIAASDQDEARKASGPVPFAVEAALSVNHDFDAETADADDEEGSDSEDDDRAAYDDNGHIALERQRLVDIMNLQRHRYVDVSGNRPGAFVSPHTDPASLPAMLPPAIDSCEVCGVVARTGRVRHVFARFVTVGAVDASMRRDWEGLNRLSPQVSRAPVLYPCCGADCAAALQSWCELRRLQSKLKK